MDCVHNDTGGGAARHSGGCSYALARWHIKYITRVMQTAKRRKRRVAYACRLPWGGCTREQDVDATK
ncbi:hypothetical protein L208DRAFT_1418352 [Tricholoma matsutake]|nr:hypothetical protein L208DRAFT_1418352 [Tricholoma matsutake 945]